jgi:hypothetical protein
MRALFASERRCILNLFQMKWGGEVSRAPVVLGETIAEPIRPKRKPWFNCDFILDFVDWRTARSERSAAACSVLPNALGAELFLIVDKATLSPTALELNGGGAFPIARYANYIGIVEAAIQEAIASPDGRETDLPQIKSSIITSVAAAAFARVLVVGDDITFLLCPEETKPVMRGQRFGLAQADDREVHCYVDGDECVCLDGWIKTEVTASERVLVSLPERAP